MYRILLVDDEENIRQALALNLYLQGYEVIQAKNGKEALQLFSNQKFHLIILDIMMPIMDGYETCKQIRLENNEIGILFLTAMESTQSKIEGLELGADDYLVKPFSLEEFLLRVKSILKRTVQDFKNNILNYSFDGNSINFENYIGTNKHGIEITFTKKEIMLLKLFIENKDKVISREQILHYVWGYDIYPKTRTIDNFLVNFRKHFEENPAQPKHFISIRGVGYKFVH
jgi:two-component system alkaline phosphatase synthesis response regulator PhoP